ncbi:MAG TPA: PQQ-binding-like beta-propeller repeat protein, partial [Humisphaera sp.]
MYRSNPTRAALWSVAFGILLAGAATATAVRAGPAPAAADPLAGALEAVPARQGLAVCVGTTDGRLEAGLADAGMLVHAVSPDRAVVLAVRAKLAEAGKAGAATVDWVPSLKALPYNDHLANLLVADLDANPTLARDEALRVVRPLGVAYLRSGGAWQVVRKPMPPAMDDWSHFDHGPDGNPQSTDRLVGVPKGLQWHASGSGTPTSNTRLAGGRWFCGHKISGPAAKDAPQHFSARDAFNGMLLWRREEDRTVGDLRGVQERSLVASDKVVVGLIGEAGPARVLDAATGKEISVLADGLARPLTKKTYGKQPQTLQHVLTDGLLVQAYGPDVVGLDAATGKPRWRWACPEGQSVAFLVAGGGRAFVGLTRDREFAQFHYQNWYADLESLAAIDLATGKQAWSTDAVAGFKSFNLVYHDGAVYTIDSAFKVSVKHPDRLDVAVPYGALVRVNAADGKLAFRKDLAGVAAKDVAWHNKLRVQDGALVPTFANAVRTFSTADGTEGKTLFELGKGFQDPLPFCSTPRGTANGQLSGKFARFADFTTQTYTAITVGRTRCDEGSYPGYGMIFTGDDGCGCTSWLR